MLPSFYEPNIHQIGWCYISDFYNSNRTLKLTSNKDIQTHRFATCAANTSEQCSIKWRGTYRDSSKASDHLEVLDPTIDLNSRGVELSSMRCRAVCMLRDKVCVSEPMFIEFPSLAGKFLVSLADKISVSNLTFSISWIYKLQIQSPDLDGWPVTARSNPLSYDLSYL